ncbi:MAG: sigma-70 family RNA polymerase sigma factor [Clostridia bacterium]|nr:sigma-70 family RNA polymerase sigma factor [Clostridia bacterium]
MSDENILILKAQDGDGEAESELMQTYAQLVAAIAHSYCSVGVDRDDLVQAGLIGLMKAIRKYDVEKGSARFKTYASTCIHNTIRTALKNHNSAPKDAPLSDAFNIPSGQNVTTDYEDEETERQLMSEISSVLNDCEKKVLHLYIAQLSYQEISDQLGIEKKKVDNTIQSFRKKIKKLLDKKQ